MITCVAVDDEPPALKIITEYCNRIPYIQLLHCFTNPVEALEYCKFYKPKLLFIDIQMPTLSGLEFNTFLDYKPLFVFTTAFSRYAVEGFELDAVDYLLKPFSFERFEKAVCKAKRSYDNKHGIFSLENEDFIIIKIDYQNVKIPLSNICYIEACDNYIKIFTDKKFYMPLMNLKAITPQLSPNKFVRVHKSYMVSVMKISHFTHESIVIGNSKIPIGRTYLPDFLEIIKKAGRVE